MATITSRTLPLRDWGSRNGDAISFQPVWHRSAPKPVARADEWGIGSKGWTAWAEYLARRRQPCAVALLLPGKRPSMAWGSATSGSAAAPAATGTLELSASELFSTLDRVERGKAWNVSAEPADVAYSWASEAAHRHRREFASECVAWCRALPALSALLPADLWWRLLELLLHEAEDAATATDGNVLSRQVLGAELPLALAYLFPEMTTTRDLAALGGRALRNGLESVADVDGMPTAHHVSKVLPLLATWTRSRAQARALKDSGWCGEVESRYSAFAQQVLRLLRRDGTTALSPAPCGVASSALIAAVLEGAPRANREIVRRAAQGDGRRKKCDTTTVPPPAANNERAGVTILRPSWSRGRERLTVVRSGHELQTELASGRDVLWSGNWSCEVRRQGETLVPDADAEWDEVCWQSNEDVDYLELELALPHGIRVQRQMLLAREDRFLFLADAVLGDQRVPLEYRSVLPLTGDSSFDASTESREGYLVGRKARALLFPLALPEWRAQPAAGTLEAVDEGLELRLAGNATRMYVPLFLDLDPRRLFQPATWRQLTVADTRQIVSAEHAVGYRVQVRNKQWLIYRSMDKRANRTVLGQNLVSDFLVARFDSKGEIAPLLDIE